MRQSTSVVDPGCPDLPPFPGLPVGFPTATGRRSSCQRTRPRPRAAAPELGRDRQQPSSTTVVRSTAPSVSHPDWSPPLAKSVRLLRVRLMWILWPSAIVERSPPDGPGELFQRGCPRRPPGVRVVAGADSGPRGIGRDHLRGDHRLQVGSAPIGVRVLRFLRAHGAPAFRPGEWSPRVREAAPPGPGRTCMTVELGNPWFARYLPSAPDGAAGGAEEARTTETRTAIAATLADGSANARSPSLDPQGLEPSKRRGGTGGRSNAPWPVAGRVPPSPPPLRARGRVFPRVRPYRLHVDLLPPTHQRRWVPGPPRHRSASGWRWHRASGCPSGSVRMDAVRCARQQVLDLARAA